LVLLAFSTQICFKFSRETLQKARVTPRFSAQYQLSPVKYRFSCFFRSHRRRASRPRLTGDGPMELQLAAPEGFLPKVPKRKILRPSSR
jgi:hypothetical protein